MTRIFSYKKLLLCVGYKKKLLRVHFLLFLIFWYHIYGLRLASLFYDLLLACALSRQGTRRERWGNVRKDY